MFKKEYNLCKLACLYCSQRNRRISWLLVNTAVSRRVQTANSSTLTYTAPAQGGAPNVTVYLFDGKSLWCTVANGEPYIRSYNMASKETRPVNIAVWSDVEAHLLTPLSESSLPIAG